LIHLSFLNALLDFSPRPDHRIPAEESGEAKTGKSRIPFKGNEGAAA